MYSVQYSIQNSFEINSKMVLINYIHYLCSKIQLKFLKNNKKWEI